MARSYRATGFSLAKGPVWVLGIVGLAFGITALIFKAHGFSTNDIPHGSVYGHRWIGVLLNGWSAVLCAAAGLALVLGAPAHWAAKTMALLVAAVLGAAAIIALIRGNGIFGIFAADHVTEIVWGAAAVLLVLLALMPRVGGRSEAPVAPVETVDSSGRPVDPAGDPEP
jgi:hypothetical protein